MLVRYPDGEAGIRSSRPRRRVQSVSVGQGADDRCREAQHSQSDRTKENARRGFSGRYQWKLCEREHWISDKDNPNPAKVNWMQDVSVQRTVTAPSCSKQLGWRDEPEDSAKSEWKAHRKCAGPWALTPAPSGMSESKRLHGRGIHLPHHLGSLLREITYEQHYQEPVICL